MTLTADDLKNIAGMLSRDLEQHTAEKYDDGFRRHLGASQIGDVCDRRLWYVFRWAAKEVYKDKFGVDNKGRMLRLFNRGHLEEVRIIEWLRGMGHEVTDKIDGKQIRINSQEGHFGGSCDGIIKFGGIYYNLPTMLLEFKTSGDKAFQKLIVEGVRKAKPQHYAQMSVYGKSLKLEYALYICVNKNDDTVHMEMVPLDWQLAGQLDAKAQKLIYAQVPPVRISENSAYFECKYCSFAPICHGQARYEKNCRSCVHSFPDRDKTWYCHLYQQTIPDDFIAKGCDYYSENR